MINVLIIFIILLVRANLKDLWFVIKIISTFSYGQAAAVESGFSINSSIISLGGIKQIDSMPINNKILESVKDANRHHKAVLEERKEADKKENEKHLGRKIRDN